MVAQVEFEEVAEETVGITDGSIRLFNRSLNFDSPTQKRGHHSACTVVDRISSRAGSQQEICSPERGFRGFSTLQNRDACIQ